MYEDLIKQQVLSSNNDDSKVKKIIALTHKNNIYQVYITLILPLCFLEVIAFLS